MDRGAWWAPWGRIELNTTEQLTQREPEAQALSQASGSAFLYQGREGREPIPDHAGESPLLSRSGGEKGLRGSGAGT